jgi:hypothetical protein
MMLGMRRLAVLGAAAVLSVLGFGAAYVLASPKAAAPGPGKIAICHATGSATNPFNLETPDASGDLNGHEGHPDDIIPAFGSYPGKNMGTIYPGGWTGADILANDCEIPTGGGGITQTTTTTVTETVPVTVTTPGTTVTVPGDTITRVITVTVSAPAQTVTTPGTTTVVTVPSGATTTVTLPSQTVTLPGVTTTVPGGTVERDPVAITVVGTTTTVAAGATPTVVTVTGPTGSGVAGAVAESKRVTVTVKTPTRTVQVKGRVVHVKGTGMFAGKRFTVLVIRACGCPVGTVLYHGHCAVSGQG